MDIIDKCQFGIHDLSRISLNEHSLPRFNMPLELGIFLGAMRFGSRKQKLKSYIILDKDKYRYQEFISDISGQDIIPHNNDPKKAIIATRSWLNSISSKSLPGGSAIFKKYMQFNTELPGICSDLHLNENEYDFIDYARMAGIWLKAQELKTLGA